jgi:uncharacterized membrane protein (DUF4010 family)
VALGTALLCGLLIGIERGWKLRGEKPGDRVAGVRTFSILGIAGGIAGLVAQLGQPIVAAALVLGSSGIVAMAYARELASHRDSTSAVAAMGTVAIGFLSGVGQPALAIGTAAIAVALLAMRTELHGFVEGLDEQDVKSLARYAVIACAVFPFLPSGHYGPFGAWNPQKLWLVVVLVTGFSYLGYIANRRFGERRGTIATALIGGMYSSTAVTQSLAERLGREEKPGSEPAGIALATAVMFVRIVLLVGVLSTRVVGDFALLMLPATVVAWAAGLWLCRNAGGSRSATAPGNPINLVPALGFLAFVAVAAVAAKWAQGRFGEQGIATLLLVTGSADVDTAIITLGGLDPTAISAPLAALALAGTVVANMVVKIGITLANARSKGKSAALALGASVVALLITIAIAWARL